ncbi:predicted protein [Naegleria gruberi]|uniref:Copper transport protein n=1 Tax=Naegleria gruberi TaxID=5762 RepID=D2UYZ5_NAEGR|nr:uncharacterized protein NAEGRDRAFT_61759 [Naegleria gruberi]EFC50057.1 predicted protein [Naegleria gruberi]|eukprot:XP_002682801.1 predicted protein [Naegleria gruberi strain NEG-M]
MNSPISLMKTMMDHSNHTMPDHSNHTMGGMQMYFVATATVPHLLFETVQITEGWQYALAIIICFILSVFNQFLVFLVKRKVTIPKKKDDDEFRDVDDHKRKARKRYMAYAWYIAKPIIYLFQNGLGYLLMLVTMTYNVGLFLAVIAGNTVGWTVFSMTSNIVPEDCCAN